MRMLNIAEKPSVAKELTNILAGGNMRRKNGISQYNPIFEFPYVVFNQTVTMVVSSVAGHMMQLDFIDSYRSWNSCDPVELFTCETKKTVKKDMEKVYKQIQQEARSCDALCLWLDCDREGENIAYEVIACAQSVKRKRARFSALIASDIKSSLNSLKRPNENEAKAADARTEIDLRIGCAFTRFQTMLLQNNEIQTLLSYGPCQFPTLGFVVERYLQRKGFVPERFWYISASVTGKEDGVDRVIRLKWNRNRLFDKLITVTLFEMIMNEKTGIVAKMKESLRNKYKPYPLNTVQLQMKCCSYLHLSSDEVLNITEFLYTNGYSSYPRTETAKFPPNYDLKGYIAMQIPNTEWGSYSSNLLNNNGFQFPRSGRGDDHAHPPIHPTKLLNRQDCPGLCKGKFNPNKVYAVYEFITRHFLACCSKDAVLSNTELEVMIGREFFSTKATVIKERNYLDIYKYDRVSEGVIPLFVVGNVLPIADLFVEEGITTAPELLSEKELIDMMDKEGIGTDATISEHIATIQARNYALKNKANRFYPTPIGLALVETYMSLDYPLYKPYLRAHMEKECSYICDGKMHFQEVIDSCIGEMTLVYNDTVSKRNEFKDTFNRFYHNEMPEGSLHVASVANVINDHFMTCKQCGGEIALMGRRDDKTIFRFLQCMSCNLSLKLPQKGSVSLTTSICPICQYSVLQITSDHNDRNSSYYCCPMCYTNPSSDNRTDIEDLGIGASLPCYMCSAKCRYAMSERIKLLKCYSCREGDLLLYKPHHSDDAPSEKSYSIRCSKYPSCKCGVIFKNEAITEIEVLEEKCLMCTDILHVDVKYLLIRFRPNTVLPTGVGNPYRYCIGGHDVMSKHVGITSTVPIDDMLKPFTLQQLQKAPLAPSAPSAPSSAPSSAPAIKWLAPVAPKAGKKPMVVVPSVPSVPSAPSAPSASVMRPSQPRPQNPQPPPRPQNPQPINRESSYHPYSARPSGQPGPWLYTSNPYNPAPQNEGGFQNRSYNEIVHQQASQAAPAMSRPPIMSAFPQAQSVQPVLCKCNLPAARRTTNKPGPNQGREFYTCPNPKDAQCGFFKWADEVGKDSAYVPGNPSMFRNPPNNAGITCYKCGEKGHMASQCMAKQKKERSRGKSEFSTPASTGGKKQRCCGLCHKPGHTRSKCPLNNPVSNNYQEPTEYTTSDYHTEYGQYEEPDTEMNGMYWESM